MVYYRTLKTTKKGSAELRNQFRFFPWVQTRNPLYEIFLGSVQNFVSSIEEKMVPYAKYQTLLVSRRTLSIFVLNPESFAFFVRNYFFFC
jgi:hypothetical protein